MAAAALAGDPGGGRGYGGAAAATLAAAEIRRRFSAYRGPSTEADGSWRHPAIRPATTGLFRSVSVAPPRGVPGPTPAPPPGAGGTGSAAAQPSGATNSPGSASASSTPPGSAVPMAPGVIAPHLAQAFEAFMAGGSGAASDGSSSGFSTGATSSAAGSGSSGAGSVVRRSPAALFSRGGASAVGASGAVGVPPGVAGVIRRTLPMTNAGGDGSATDTSIRSSLSAREWEELVDEVVRRIEYRVADELARRGRRFTPPVY
jgi:hypothetical protein